LIAKQTSVYSKIYIYLTCTRPYRCRIIEYSRLSDSAHTVWSSYRQFFVTAPILGLYSTTNQRSIPFGYLLYLLVQGHQASFLSFLESL